MFLFDKCWMEYRHTNLYFGRQVTKFTVSGSIYSRISDITFDLSRSSRMERLFRIIVFLSLTPCKWLLRMRMWLTFISVISFFILVITLSILLCHCSPCFATNVVSLSYSSPISPICFFRSFAIS